MHRHILYPAIALLLVFGGCLPVAGANTEESKPGNKDGGNRLGADVVISADGHWLIAQAQPSQRLWAVDLYTFRGRPLAGSDGDEARLVFGRGDLALITRPVATWSAQGTRLTTEVQEVSLATGQSLRTWTLDGLSPAIAIDASGTHVAVWGASATAGHTVTVIDLVASTKRTTVYDDTIVDAKWVPATGELAVVERTPTFSQTLVHFVGTGAAIASTTVVPNCPSTLQISPDGRTALLSPSFCSKDPVSVINLVTHAFVKNLPGFGPAAWSPDGRYAVAFGRRADLLEVAGIQTTARYSLLFFELPGLSMEVLELGDDLPIYSVTPDGEVVLLYSLIHGSAYDGIYMVDVQTRTIRETMGPEVDLREFVMTPDGQLVYLIDGGLFQLDVSTGRIDYVQLPCGAPGMPTRCNPDMVNILPNGQTLVLGYRDLAQFAFYDVPSSHVDAVLEVGSNQTSVATVTP